MSGDSRRSDRHHVRFKLVYDDGESYHAGWVHDLSDSGVFLVTRETLPVGTRVNLSSLELDEEHGFELTARVVRVVEPDPDHPDEAFGMGLEFESLSDQQRILLLALIERFEEEASAFEGEPDPYFGKSLPRDGLRRTPSGVWRPEARPATTTARTRSVSREPGTRPAEGHGDSNGDGDGDGEPASSFHLPILDPVPVDDVRFEAPTEHGEFLPHACAGPPSVVDPDTLPIPRPSEAIPGGARPAGWPSAPWRDNEPTQQERPRRPSRRRFFELADDDFGSAIDRVVDDRGRTIDDVVLLDESEVSPYLIDAQLGAPPPSGDDLGREPLDGDAFARTEVESPREPGPAPARDDSSPGQR